MKVGNCIVLYYFFAVCFFVSLLLSENFYLFSLGEAVNCPKLFNGKYAHPTNCAMFISCTNGVAVENVCPANLLFDINKNRCEDAVNVTCGSLIASKSRST